MITFLRRKKLGAGSLRGMVAYLNSNLNSNDCSPRGLSVTKHYGEKVSIVRNDKLQEAHAILSDTDLLIRWGCTSMSGIPLDRQVNTSKAIKMCNDKMHTRMMIQENHPTCVPNTVICSESNEGNWPRVLRPRYHAQGRNLFVVNDMQELLNVVNENTLVFAQGWYASELVDKVAEYRVYVVSGKVATVAHKTPDDPNAVAWNVHQGGRFDVVRWGEWPLEVCRVAIEAFNLIDGLDFSGVDVMVDREGRAYVIELNSAPSLPLLSDGSVSYRQKCMAKCFRWMVEHGKERFDTGSNYYHHFSGVIHPAIQEYN